MSCLDTSECVWPPRGWAQLDNIDKLCGRVIAKDPEYGKVFGLSYNIVPTPVISKQNNKKFIFHFQIDGWEYDIKNTSREFPILSFDIKEKIDDLQNRFLLLNIRSKGRPLKASQILSQRVLKAALHFIREIDAGCAPDIEHSLLLYKVHPTKNLIVNDSQQKLRALIKELFEKSDNNNAA